MDAIMKRIEKENGVEILFATEGEPNSLRFIYLNDPSWYVSIDRQPTAEIICRYDMIDCEGWDLRKTLGLIRKSDPRIFEWLRCSMVYHWTPMMDDIVDLAPEYFDPRSVAFTYREQAMDLFRDNLSTKNIISVVRALLCSDNVVKFREVPPESWKELLEYSGQFPKFHEDISKIINDQHRSINRSSSISRWINQEIIRLGTEARGMPKLEKKESGPLDEILRGMVCMTS